MAEKKTSIGKMMIYGLMALLFVGLGGFGATNFSGGIRSVGHVGEVPISVQDYSNGLRNQIRAVEAETGQPLPFQQAQAAGLPQQVLAQVVVATALESEAATLGISVGDDRLADEIMNTQAFQGVNGEFDRQAYEYALQNIGMRERDFEEGLRSESAATILQGSVLAGIKLPDTYVDTLVSYSGERRAFTWAELGPETLSLGMPVPTDEQLTALYEENIADYTRPETKSITFAWLTPDMIVDTVEVDEASLREAYAEREAEFNMPERRLVERLVYGDDAEAQAAVDRITSGKATFEQLVAERDLTLADTDMGDVTKGDLGAAADSVFAAEVGAVTGPAPSDLGPAVFRVNAVLPEQSTSFEDATPDLRDALALDRARRTIEQQAQEFDDQLAAGATLEELADTTDLQLGTIGWTGQDTDGAIAGTDGAIAGYEDFREAANTLSADDYPSVTELGDGGLFAMRLEEILSPAPLPFEDVRAEVEKSFERAERVKALVAEAEALSTQLTEGKTFEDLSLTANTEAGLTRTAYGPDLSIEVLTAVFEMEPGEYRAVPDGNGAILVRLDDIIAADTEGENAQMLTNLFGNQAANDVSQDLFRALSADIQQRAGVNIDQQAINAVHVNFQ